LEVIELGKKFFLLVLVFSLSMFIVPNEKASAACSVGSNTVVDNDNNGIDSPDNSYVGDWIYESAGSSYRDDHRFTYPPSSGWDLYYWKFSPCSLTSSMKIYINNVKFNNENVSYLTFKGGTSVNSKTVNQRTAPGGWSHLLYGSAGIDSVRLTVSYVSSGGAGADGIQLIYQ
jgi:hypothetical protein